MTDPAPPDGVTGTGDRYHAYVGLRPFLDGIPLTLTSVDQWVLWRATPKPKGGMNKVPCQPNGRAASSVDPKTWSDFGSCWSAYEESPEEFAGVGFVLTEGDDFIGGDLDHCRDPETSELTPQAARIVEALGTYCEVSPSGTGVRFVGRGDLGRSVKGNGIEVYRSGRFLTITGVRLDHTPEEIRPLDPRHIARLREIATGRRENGADTGPQGSDPVVARLKEEGLYQRALSDGRHLVTCPWVDAHTGGDTSGTVYMEAHHGGHARASFVCQHSHCGDKRIGDLLEHLGLGAGADERPKVPSPEDLVITEEEMAAAPLTPRCIVRDYLYCDVAQLAGPGSAGKTTMILYEAVHIALGWALWGLEVTSPGWTLFVSAEDQRPYLVARLREILGALALSPEERAIVLRSVRIWDVTGQTLRLITLMEGTVALTTLADDITEAYREDPPRIVVFDPLVSFGASETLVNDNEQGLVTAARRIVKGLGCCVRVSHHIGKANARDKTLDQYTGRGGSALADGTRMTAVLQPWSPEDTKHKPPPELVPEAGEGLAILARAKLSYSPPHLPLIWIRRQRFAYSFAVDTAASADAVRAEYAERVLAFLEAELAARRYHTKRGLDEYAKDLRMTRESLRRAVADLEARVELVEDDLPPERRQGSRKTYLRPCRRGSNCAVDLGAVGART